MASSAPLARFDELPPNLKRAVQLFKEWADLHPDNAAHEDYSIHELFRNLKPLMPHSPPIAGQQVIQRNHVATYLTAAKTRNQPWWALCFWALQLYDHEDAAPAPLRYFAAEFGKRLQWPAPTRPPTAGEETSDPGDVAATVARLRTTLQEYALQGAEADLTGMTYAAKYLAPLLLAELTSNASQDAYHALNTEAVLTAERLCNLADVVIIRVNQASPGEVTDNIRRCCAEVFDAATQAHRRLARTPGRETQEIGMLAALRESDIRITESIRTDVERVLMRYHSHHSKSLLRGRRDHQLLAEIAAARRLVSELTAIKKAAGPAFTVVRLGSRRPELDGTIDTDRLVGVACRLACAAACAVDDGANAGVNFDELRRSLVNLFPRGQDRHDVNWLLKLAAGPPDAVYGASEVLRIARIRGIGDYLLARMFVAASCTDYGAVGILHRDRYRLFHPLEGDLVRRVASPGEQRLVDETREQFLARLRERRRVVILQRAAGLYARAIDWLRESGAAGQLRARAQAELAAIDGALDPSLPSHDPLAVLHALSGLRRRVHEMTIDGFLWADIGASTNMNDPKVAFSATLLLAALDQAQRYLAQPELSSTAET
ncbi:hypothetical protein BayCH28_20070 [Mycolicibacterium sp. CH28]|uniref:hypothetical protein n=1 Tax=Mycolicibacterium sp. CH28 TaxID=2512237 RepID=UPI0010819160|nr:hypothetical protein [Mycolicibacterium sp. CH28]TGD85340.1 hypothetical protein BayCH28_20070 [Mycolicibacterium sp. CH28]